MVRSILITKLQFARWTILGSAALVGYDALTRGYMTQTLGPNELWQMLALFAGGWILLGIIVARLRR